MSTIVLRATKGSPLTNTEVDNNFTNLNTDKLEANWTGNTTLVTLGTVTTGTWSATTIAANKGGTGQSAYTVGDLLYASSTSNLSKLVLGTTGQVLTAGASGPTYVNQSTLSVGSSVNISGGAAGSLPYNTASGTTTFLSIGSANSILTSTVSGPVWSTYIGISQGGTGGTTVAQAQTNLQVDPAGTAVALSIALG